MGRIDGETTPIYGRRMVLNVGDLRRHYEDYLDLDNDLHVTVVYSREPFDPVTTPRPVAAESQLTLDDASWEPRAHENLGHGDSAKTVLLLSSFALSWEWQHYVARGASWDYPEYRPHVSLCDVIDSSALPPPYVGPIVLGPLQFEPMRQTPVGKIAGERQGDLHSGGGRASVSSMDAKLDSSVKIVKMDEDQMIIWGWASVAKIGGEEVYDSHGDHIPMEELERASIDFMTKSRTGLAMHDGSKVSEVIGSLPLSAELAKALGITCDREGWIIGKKFYDRDVWNRVKSGELPAMSIGGRGVRVPV